MKKVLALILAVAMLAALAGCGSKDKDLLAIVGEYSADSHTYSNEFFGFGCKLDKDWAVLDGDQLAQYSGQAVDLTDTKSISDALKNDSLFPFFAQTNSGVNVSVGVEDLGALYGAVLSEKEYADKVTSDLNDESTGMTNATFKVGTITFAGAEHATVTTTGSMLGVDVYQTMVCVKSGNYMGVVTATSYNMNETEEILSMFYAL